jgi:hypothetical protein
LLRSCGWFSRALDVENIWKSYLLEKKCSFYPYSSVNIINFPNTFMLYIT